MTLAAKVPNGSETTIAAAFPLALIEYAAAKGIAKEALMASAGMVGSALGGPDARIPLSRYVTMLDVAAELSNDPGLALRFGQAMRLEDISIAGLIATASNTIGEGRLQLNRYARLVINEDGAAPAMLEMTRNENGVWLELTSTLYRKHPRLVEAGFARFVCGARLAGIGGFPAAIHFCHPEPSYRDAYDDVFQAPLVFNSNRNAVLTDDAFLSIKLPPANRYVFGVLSERAERLLKELETVTSTRGKVENALLPILHTGEASMERIARSIGCSVQTLYRRLKAESVTFDEVFDDLRRRLALSYLADKKVSIAETAYLTGFSDASAFSRAFKRWTGRCPSDASQQNPSNAAGETGNGGEAQSEVS